MSHGTPDPTPIVRPGSAEDPYTALARRILQEVDRFTDVLEKNRRMFWDGAVEDILDRWPSPRPVGSPENSIPKEFFAFYQEILLNSSREYLAACHPAAMSLVANILKAFDEEAIPGDLPEPNTTEEVIWGSKSG